MKALVCASYQEKALVGAFSVIVQPVVEPMERLAALGETPLLRSILAGHADLVRLLLALPEVDLGVGTADGYTALHVAAWRGRPEITRMLLEDGRLDVNDFHRKHYLL